MKRFLFESLLPGYLALCIVLGGASASGFILNAVLQLAAVAIIVGLAWRGESVDAEMGGRLPRVIGSGLIAWLLIQLIPLPPTLWQAIPGRGSVIAGDAMLALEHVWRPISLQPSKTLISGASLLPFFAIFLLTVAVGERSRTAAGWAIIVVAVVSALIGVIQLSQNVSGGAYFYRITNYGATVGFFANANHLATLFLVALLISSEIVSSRSSGRAVFWTIVKWTLVGFFALNIVVNGSVAGLGLMVGALVFVALRQPKIRTRIGGSKRWLAAICLVTGPFIVWFIWKFSGKLAVFANTSVGADMRLEFAGNTLRMIFDSFPFGFGLGTFQAVYQTYERPTGSISTFVNHAHNDFLEVIADLGLPAVVLLGLFAVWFIRRLMWMRRSYAKLSGYVYASAMAIALIAAHSFFDYPLRTSAIAAVFAFACGCLARPIARENGPRRRRSAASLVDLTRLAPRLN